MLYTLNPITPQPFNIAYVTYSKPQPFIDDWFMEATKTIPERISKIWEESFDEIICITLSTRPDRRARAEKFFKELGIPVRFFVAQPHPLGGRYGCLHSHISVAWWLQKQLSHKPKFKAVVFEDDVIITDYYDEQQIAHAVKWMDENIIKWDLFFLGSIPIFHYLGRLLSPYGRGGNAVDVFPDGTLIELGGDNYEDPHIIKYRPVGAHAYVYSKRGIERVLNGLELAPDPSDPADRAAAKLSPSFIRCVKGQVDCEAYFETNPIHFDMYINTKRFDSYTYVPSLFEQDWCIGSDNKPGSWAEAVGRALSCSKGQVTKRNVLSTMWPWIGWRWFVLLSLFLCVILLFIILRFHSPKL